MPNRWRAALLLMCPSSLFVGCSEDTSRARQSEPEDALVEVDVTHDDAAIAEPVVTPMLPMVLTVQCGERSCSQPVSLNRAMRPCCLDPQLGTCGYSLLTGNSCMLPPSDVAGCPAVELSAGLKLASCCTAEGQCGVNGTMFGLPACTGLAAARALGQGSSPLSFPEPRACETPLDAAVQSAVDGSASDASSDTDAQTRDDDASADMVDAAHAG